MCSSPSVPPPPPPPAQPVPLPRETLDPPKFETANSNKPKRGNGRSGLSIPAASTSTVSGMSGLNIPR